jgi:hypothetical protein
LFPQALRATYPEDEGCLTFAPEELEAIGAVQTALQNPHVPLFKLPNISGTIRCLKQYNNRTCHGIQDSFAQ